jgi:hypothetical protein
MQPEMPCGLTTKMEVQPSLRQRSPVPKLPLGRPVAAIHRRGHQQAAVMHHPDLLQAAAIRHPDLLQVAAVAIAIAIHHPDLLQAAAIRRQSQLPAVRPPRPLSRHLQAMAIVRRLNKPNGQKPIKGPRHRT